jgi:hypothetical protein
MANDGARPRRASRSQSATGRLPIAHWPDEAFDLDAVQTICSTQCMRDTQLLPSRPTSEREKVRQPERRDGTARTQYPALEPASPGASFCPPELVIARCSIEQIDERLTSGGGGVPLRNRTVDLLLTIENRTVPRRPIPPFNSANASSCWQRLALISPRERHHDTQSDTEIGLQEGIRVRRGAMPSPGTEIFIIPDRDDEDLD